MQYLTSAAIAQDSGAALKVESISERVRDYFRPLFYSDDLTATANC